MCSNARPTEAKSSLRNSQIADRSLLVGKGHLSGSSRAHVDHAHSMASLPFDAASCSKIGKVPWIRRATITWRRRDGNVGLGRTFLQPVRRLASAGHTLQTSWKCKTAASPKAPAPISAPPNPPTRFTGKSTPLL
jgi:hypothetical protein